MENALPQVPPIPLAKPLSLTPVPANSPPKSLRQAVFWLIRLQIRVIISLLSGFVHKSWVNLCFPNLFQPPRHGLVFAYISLILNTLHIFVTQLADSDLNIVLGVDSMPYFSPFLPLHSQLSLGRWSGGRGKVNKKITKLVNVVVLKDFRKRKKVFSDGGGGSMDLWLVGGAWSGPGGVSLWLARRMGLWVLNSGFLCFALYGNLPLDGVIWVKHPSFYSVPAQEMHCVL